MKIETTLEQMKESYDWKEAFEYADPDPVEGAKCLGNEFTRDDVACVLASSEGENDGPAWLAVFKLKDGRYAFLSAGCDYTGWDCSAGGYACVADDLEQLIQFGLGQEDRVRLGAEP